MAHIKVKDCDNLVRDTESGAILNLDERGYRAYLKKKELAKEKKEKQKRLEDEINNIQKDVKELKDTLKILIETLHASNK